MYPPSPGTSLARGPVSPGGRSAEDQRSPRSCPSMGSMNIDLYQSGETTSPMHSSQQEQHPRSWLGRAISPLQRLIRFRGNQTLQHEPEDERLAGIAAAITAAPQPRTFPDVNVTVAVIGCGRMGCDIVGELLRRGCHVRVYDVTPFTRQRAMQTILATLHKHVEVSSLQPRTPFEQASAPRALSTAPAARAHPRSCLYSPPFC